MEVYPGTRHYSVSDERETKWSVASVWWRPGRGRCVQEEDVEDVAGCSWAQPRPAEAGQRLALRHSGAGGGMLGGAGDCLASVHPPPPRPAPLAGTAWPETDDGDTVHRQDSFM